MLGIGIHGGERGYGADEHGHRMRVVAETFHEFLGGFMEHGVVGNLVDPVFQLARVRQFPEQEQIGHFKISAVLGENFDGISAIAQDSAIAVDIGNCAAAGCGVGECGVVGHQAEVFGAGLDLAKIHRTDGSVFNGNGVVLSGAVVGDG